MQCGPLKVSWYSRFFHKAVSKSLKNREIPLSGRVRRYIIQIEDAQTFCWSSTNQAFHEGKYALKLHLHSINTQILAITLGFSREKIKSNDVFQRDQNPSCDKLTVTAFSKYEREVQKRLYDVYKHGVPANNPVHLDRKLARFDFLCIAHFSLLSSYYETNLDVSLNLYWPALYTYLNYCRQTMTTVYQKYVRSFFLGPAGQLSWHWSNA